VIKAKEEKWESSESTFYRKKTMMNQWKRSKKIVALAKTRIVM